MNISISPEGSLHVTGGALGHALNPRPTSKVDVVDLSSGERSRGPPMRHPRFRHAAAASTTLLFVFGGIDDSGLNSCEAFNHQTSPALKTFYCLTNNSLKIISID